MDTFNAFNPEPEVEKGRWFTGPTFTTFLIGLAVGFAAHSFWVGTPSSEGDVLAEGDVTPNAEEQTAALGDAENNDSLLGGFLGDKKKEPTAVSAGENILVVSNQPAGEKVVVSMVSVGMNGWVAVHEGATDGTMGNVLGARRFDAGKYFGETVELLRGTVEDKTYFVVLHADNGDKEFDYKAEMPVKDTDGNFVSGTFIATAIVLE